MSRIASAGNVETFRFPPGTGFTGMWGMVQFSAVAAFMLISVFVLEDRPSKQPWFNLAIIYGASLCFGFMTWVGWRVWRHRHAEVRTDAAEITWSLPRDRELTMRWAEVKEINEREWRRKLELVDGRRRLSLAYELVDFERLQEIVRHHTPHLREEHVQIHAFRMRPLTRWLLLASGLFMIALAVLGAMQRSFVSVLGLVFATVPMIWYGRLARSLEIGAGGLELATPFRKERVPWPDIVDVVLLHERNDYALLGPSPTVRIKLRTSKDIRLSAIEGTIPLFHAVEAAWRCAGAAAVTATSVSHQER